MALALSWAYDALRATIKAGGSPCCRREVLPTSRYMFSLLVYDRRDCRPNLVSRAIGISYRAWSVPTRYISARQGYICLRKSYASVSVYTGNSTETACPDAPTS
jgi:hypothetical protein